MTITEIAGYAHVYSGKVRDLYAPLDPAGQPRDDLLLLVASDRISAFDFALEPAIPDKGAVLTQLSLWWFDQLADLVPNHVISATDVPDEVRGRAVLVRRLAMLPVECVARAYLTGGGLREYRADGHVSGVRLPAGLVDGSRLPEPVFTPSTKAPSGEHDQPMTYAQVERTIGADLAAQARDLTVAILARGNEIAADRGILIADTKVELGVLQEGGEDGRLVLADEVLTPDSSRFWPADQWKPGHPQPSFDKEFVREWLSSSESGWDRTGDTPPPELPADVVERTRAKYVEAYERLTGHPFRAPQQR